MPTSRRKREPTLEEEASRAAGKRVALNRRILGRFRQLDIVIADPLATVLLSRDATPPHVSAVQHSMVDAGRKPAADAGVQEPG